MAIQLREGIYWVGAIDWEIRNVHGYVTPRGTTYNAYLIIDEKITVIDTVKASHTEEMMKRISKIVDPKDIDYIISLHGELDHSGAIPRLYDAAENATIIASKDDIKHLHLHFHRDDFRVIEKKTGDSVSLGKRSLHFVTIPMVHWPDSMVGYMPEEKILFSNDAFGQHLASSERFDYEYPTDIIFEELKKYYANIVMPYAMPVKRALDAVDGLDIEMIANAHGLIWTKKENIERVQEEYRSWSNHEQDGKAIIVYDSMWESTKKMAYAVQEALEDAGIEYHMFSLHAHTDDISDIIPYLMTCKYVFVGSPNLNNTILPTIGAFMTYAKGFKARNKVAMAFGSYGWSNSATKEINAFFESQKWEILPSIESEFVPDANALDALRDHVIEQVKASETAE
ncbi:FprA family A-type flavoprotein [Culicoidibacter larvae]|uniref:FprA family A-type flavoprotein n=1 Tax=Culicoidibacter larvae TaxID=2579976 RepID=A0A5R8QFJ9_9FIRM|nr:FprA family A-type flavoprotein [Culicoidibacter larvae]TLG76530.1 FprA family A-type flavoprotein [Culicoidibacter larvae]